MADFCKECSEMMFDHDYKDLAGLSTEQDTNEGLFPSVTCEGCGFIQVDHTGKCIGGRACYENHQYPSP